MKSGLGKIACVFFIALTFRASAATLYVDLNSTNPVPPYAGWSTAATNIQDAVDAANPGDTVLVTNGIYQFGGASGFGSSNRVYVGLQNVTVQSVNGPAVTVIKGSPGATNGVGAARGVFLADNSILSGFTVTGGATYISDNYYGGGISCQSATAIVTNCIITGNASGRGGGVNSGTLNDCVISQNTGTSGGGVYMSQLNDCLVVGNTATYGGGGYGGVYNNCTIITNMASTSGGGVYGGTGATLNNSIIYFNSAPAGANLSGAKFNYSCSTPPLFGEGDITNDPAFVNLAAGDFHLSPLSPCINAGTNSAVNTGTDLDGNPRIVAGVVDMGAYEFQSPIRYVNVSNAAPVPPFASWATAATNIQDAVDAATNGDLILVTNGVYKSGGRAFIWLTNRVMVYKPVTLQSVNGPLVTIIQGHQEAGITNSTNAVRCVYLTNNAALIGFTLTNGGTFPANLAAGYMWTLGGGVFCNDRSAVVSNCILINNSAGDDGGGVQGGTLIDCTIEANSSTYGGGAANSPTGGGGTYGTTLINCLVVSNNAAFAGGGVYGCTLNDCLIIGNSADYNSSAGGGSFGGTLNSCTLVGNSAVTGGGAANGTLNNCIIYYNSRGNYASVDLNYCCTAPLPSRFANITNVPLFVDPASGNYHLQYASPCINSGNNAYVTTATDLDGDPRIVGGTVDIGAYEYQTPISKISYAWLQQYGLPITTNTDTADPDGDHMNNYQEWIAGTDPINPLSLLEMLPPVPTNNPASLVVSWESVSNRTYFLQRSTHLAAQPAFSTIQSNLAGQAGTTSYMDTNATNGGPYFYRVGVQQ